MKQNNSNIDQMTLKYREISILHIPYLIHGEGSILKRSSKWSKLDQEC